MRVIQNARPRSNADPANSLSSSFSRNFRGHSGCGGGGGGSSFLRPGPVQRIAFIVSFSAPPPRRTVHGRPPRGRPERPWPDHTARSYRYSLISFRLAAGEGHLGLHSFRRANITMREEVGARSHLADPVSGRCHCVRASFESWHHPPRFVRGQSILQRPFGSVAQKRRLAGVDCAWW
jgi:hypothetical protein